LLDKIPPTPFLYDGSAGQPYFILGGASPLRDPGVVTSDGIDFNNPLASVSVKKWVNSTYHASGVNTASFVNYIKSKKDYNLITDGDLNKIQANKVNIFTSDVTIANATDASKIYGGTNTPIMIILENANISINIGNAAVPGAFNPGKSSLVIIAASEGSGGKITFTSGTSEANGIFIADTIDTSSTTNQGLSIEGNLITNSLTNGRKWTDNRRPSLYVVHSPQMYIDLFSFLSKPTYEWTQLQ